MTSLDARALRPATENPAILRGTALHETFEQHNAWLDYVENVLADARQRGELP